MGYNLCCANTSIKKMFSYPIHIRRFVTMIVDVFRCMLLCVEVQKSSYCKNFIAFIFQESALISLMCLYPVNLCVWIPNLIEFECYIY